METNFRLSYELSGKGWARVVVGAGAEDVEMRASYLTDALGDMVRSIVEMIDGASRVWWAWQDEPGEHRWSLERHAYGLRGDSVRIGVLSDAATARWRGLSPSERQARFAGSSDVTVEPDGTVINKSSGESLEFVFLWTVSWKEFLTVVLLAADAVLNSAGGAEGYTKAWIDDEMPFPSVAVERIRQELASLG